MFLCTRLAGQPVLGRGLNLGTLEYKAGLLTTTP
jgi:hypothetical protein